MILLLLGLALWVGALQFVVDQGEQRDWFASHLIQSAAILSVLALAAFLVHGIRKGQDSVVDLSLFADRNFTVANAVMAGFAVCMFGTIAVLPSFVQGLMDYPVIAAGELFIPRGANHSVRNIGNTRATWLFGYNS